MIKKTLLVVASVAVGLVAFGAILYLTNTPPSVPAVSIAEAASPSKPYVVKLHAQWCPICMVTQGVWRQIEDTYSGRVNLVVLDFTDQANAAASEAEARRLGLEKFFEEFGGATGTIAVVDQRTKQVTAAISGSRDIAEYRAAIDAALSGAAK